MVEHGLFDPLRQPALTAGSSGPARRRLEVDEQFGLHRLLHGQLCRFSWTCDRSSLGRRGTRELGQGEGSMGCMDFLSLLRESPGGSRMPAC